ncbi:MAG: hypothetical protein A2Y17_00980 [Clostridiales bacterium GWF2_38_85]|nr:MAG: hypothetical protein A2Y17_00980 [Clostridiales bacterium GWF2_38_85]HBL84535.1 esterase [Clostridiales bacterium]
MALLHVNFFSEVLGQCTNMEVILPQQAFGQIGIESKEGGDSYPVLYLLHGMSDDCTIWGRRTSIERYASSLGIAVVMPSAHLSWYTDMVCGGNYFKFFADELPSICRDFFPKISSKREDNFVAGLSMGGYGALKLAFRRPEKFAFVGALSGAFDIKAFDYYPKLWEQIFGGMDKINGSENDLFHLASEVKKSGKQIPEFYMSCGKDDYIFAHSEKMDKHLTDIGIEHTYGRFEGAHTWEYWDEHIQDILKKLPIKR